MKRGFGRTAWRWLAAALVVLGAAAWWQQGEAIFFASLGAMIC